MLVVRGRVQFNVDDPVGGLVVDLGSGGFVVEGELVYCLHSLNIMPNTLLTLIMLYLSILHHRRLLILRHRLQHHRSTIIITHLRLLLSIPHPLILFWNYYLLLAIIDNYRALVQRLLLILRLNRLLVGLGRVFRMCQLL